MVWREYAGRSTPAGIKGRNTLENHLLTLEIFLKRVLSRKALI